MRYEIVRQNGRWNVKRPDGSMAFQFGFAEQEVARSVCRELNYAYVVRS